MDKLPIEKIKNSAPFRMTGAFIGSKLFPIAMAAVMLLCYYLGWDIVAIWFLAVCAAGILITCRDATPAFALFLFMHIIISMQNSPSPLGDKSDYFTRPEIYGQVIAAIGISVLILIVRLGHNIGTGAFRPTPMFWGICALSGAFLLNGLFTPGYTPMNLVYGIFLAAIFIGIYMLVSANVKVSRRTFESIAFYFAVFSAVLAVELIVAYATYDGLFDGGIVDRSELFFGWGMYNNIGMLFCICIPAWFYLAITQKYGPVYTAFGLANTFITFYTMSRQSMLGAALAGIGCIVWLFIRRDGRDRIINIVIVALAAIYVAIIVGVRHDAILVYFKEISENIKDGGNRVDLWKRAVEDFLKAPVFGVGFYYLKDLDAGFVGLNIIPLMYHNTLLQMLGACGIVGLAAYLIHRVQTVFSFTKNITTERVYLAITLGVFLFICLFDNHMFYIFPTILYTGLIALLKASENKNTSD